MSLKKCVVTLTAEERSLLQSLVSKDKVGARKRLRAQILLKADEGAARPELERRAYRPEALDVGMCARSLERVRRRLVEEGLEGALERKRQKNRRALAGSTAMAKPIW